MNLWYDTIMDQTQLLRRMSGKSRLEQAFRLSDFVRELSLKNIRTDKKITKKQAIREVSRRIYAI